MLSKQALSRVGRQFHRTPVEGQVWQQERTSAMPSLRPVYVRQRARKRQPAVVSKFTPWYACALKRCMILDEHIRWLSPCCRIRCLAPRSSAIINIPALTIYSVTLGAATIGHILYFASHIPLTKGPWSDVLLLSNIFSAEHIFYHLLLLTC